MKNLAKRSAPLLGILFALAVQIFVKDYRRHPAASCPYFAYFLAAAALVVAAVFVSSFFCKKTRDFLDDKGTLVALAGIAVTVLNVLTAKTGVLPVMLFPSFDNILSVFVEKKVLMARCFFSSIRLLSAGIFWGVLFGFVTGVGVGYFRRVNYWLTPLIKAIGPIPATAWIPISLVVFPTTFGASVFIIALSVWFPVMLLTSSGIENVPNAYFEVGRTLGAGKIDQIFRIAIPSAMPNIFQGIFFGVCSSFIALMTAEMFGAKAGIGWFINMEKEMAEFKGVYAGLIMIALFCSVILKLLTLLRRRVLRWQEGLVKW